MLAGDAVGVLNQTLLGLAAFHGLARENMTRAQAWRFLDMGLRLERAVYLATLLDATLRSPEAENPSLLEAVLEVVDSSITFRSRYNLLPTVPAVFDLVLLDDKNPRSVLFQIKQLVKHFEQLPREREDAAGLGQKNFGQTASRGWNTPTRANWPARPPAGRIPRWPRPSGRRCATLPQLSDAIAASYFAHSAISRTGPGKRAMNYHITHRTLYEYAAPVSVSHHVARLEPRATATQARDKFFAQDFSRTGAAQGAPGLFRQPALFFHHPGNPQPAGNHHPQPRDGAPEKSGAERIRRAVGIRGGDVPRPGVAGSGRAVSVCF